MQDELRDVDGMRRRASRIRRVHGAGAIAAVERVAVPAVRERDHQSQLRACRAVVGEGGAVRPRIRPRHRARPVHHRGALRRRGRFVAGDQADARGHTDRAGCDGGGGAPVEEGPRRRQRPAVLVDDRRPVGRGIGRRGAGRLAATETRGRRGGGDRPVAEEVVLHRHPGHPRHHDGVVRGPGCGGAGVGEDAGVGTAGREPRGGDVWWRRRGDGRRGDCGGSGRQDEGCSRAESESPGAAEAGAERTAAWRASGRGAGRAARETKRSHASKWMPTPFGP